MRWSQMHIPTLREDPADAGSPSHRLLLRAGAAELTDRATGETRQVPLDEVAEAVRKVVTAAR
jgi:prolyl-tRNA synthetase